MFMFIYCSGSQQRNEVNKLSIRFYQYKKSKCITARIVSARNDNSLHVKNTKSECRRTQI